MFDIKCDVKSERVRARMLDFICKIPFSGTYLFRGRMFRRVFYTLSGNMPLLKSIRV